MCTFGCITYWRAALTAPNASASIVCMAGRPSGWSGTAARTARRPTSVMPVTVQNVTWRTPAVTKWLSESGRNLAAKIRCVCPGALATSVPRGGASDNRVQRCRTWRTENYLSTVAAFIFWITILKYNCCRPSIIPANRQATFTIIQ